MQNENKFLRSEMMVSSFWHKIFEYSLLIGVTNTKITVSIYTFVYELVLQFLSAVQPRIFEILGPAILFIRIDIMKESSYIHTTKSKTLFSKS